MVVVKSYDNEERFVFLVYRRSNSASLFESELQPYHQLTFGRCRVDPTFKRSSVQNCGRGHAFKTLTSRLIHPRPWGGLHLSSHFVILDDSFYSTVSKYLHLQPELTGHEQRCPSRRQRAANAQNMLQAAVKVHITDMKAMKVEYAEYDALRMGDPNLRQNF